MIWCWMARLSISWEYQLTPNWRETGGGRYITAHLRYVVLHNAGHVVRGESVRPAAARAVSAHHAYRGQRSERRQSQDSSFTSPHPVLCMQSLTPTSIYSIYIYIPSRVTLDTELCSVFRVKACICSPFCSLCISSFLHFNPFHHISKAANGPHALPFASRRLLWIWWFLCSWSQSPEPLMECTIENPREGERQKSLLLFFALFSFTLCCIWAMLISTSFTQEAH